MNQASQLLRAALRQLRTAPAFVIAVLLTLAVGIGANTATFSFVHGLLLKKYPYAEPERLVVVLGVNPRRGFAEGSISMPDFADFRDQARSLEGLAAIWPEPLNLVGSGEPMRVKVAQVSADLFSLLGIRPALGRDFEEGADQAGEPAVLLLSHRLWRRAFGADEQVLGRTLQLEGEPATVIGVLPPEGQFPGTDAAELFVPLRRDPARMPRRGRPLTALGRLTRGVTLEAAQTELSALAKQLEETYPESNSGWGVRLVPLREFRTSAYQNLYLLFGAVAFVLLIAWLNVANLMLQRAFQRRREMALRSTLGANRRQLLAQLLTESLVLAVGGGLLGVLVAWWLIRLFLRLLPLDLAGHLNIGLATPVLLFALALSLVSALVFGILPVLRSPERHLAERLQQDGSRSVGPGRHRAGLALVAAETAVTLILLVGALLVVTSLYRLQRVNPGFRTEGVLSAGLALPAMSYREAHQRITFLERLRRRVEALPGVDALSTGTTLPGSGWFTTSFSIEGQSPEEKEANPRISFQMFSGEYFKTLGIPLLAGRAFTAQDDGEAPKVAVISSRLAALIWSGRSAIDQQLRLDMMMLRRSPLTVVGVVGDIRNEGLAAGPGLAVYLPYEQTSMGELRCSSKATRRQPSWLRCCAPRFGTSTRWCRWTKSVRWTG